MRPRTRLLSAFTLSTAIAFGVVAMAADLPKEGTFSGTLSNSGTVKATPVGKERLLVMFDENGSVVSNGLLDHTTVHCWGLGDYANGVGQAHGYCVSMDPAGDQIVINITGDGRLDAKSFTVMGRPRSQRALASMPASAVVIRSFFMGRNSGRRLKAPTSNTERWRVVTNSHDVGTNEKQQPSRRGRAKVAPLLLLCVNQDYWTSRKVWP